MPHSLSRRDFLRTSLALGAGAGLSLPLLARMQNDSATPESTPEAGAPFAGGLTELPLTGMLRRVHDPVLIKDEDTYYVFCTGAGIPVRSSVDMLDWKLEFPPKVFASTPQWVQEAIPNQNDFWAPDISYFNGKYHLYYSVSTFGSNRSVIGLATNVTLNPRSDDFQWVDEGLVIESQRNYNYNCIDPNLVIDADGVPWLAFGSFWSGIKMRRIDAETGKLSEADTTLYALAQRHVNSGAVEAPFIIRHGDFYYLFVSFDSCCQGTDSTYHVMVGRSESVTGPYVDRDGVAMLDGGGTQVTFPSERWRGPGHNGIWQENGIDYIVYHAYDAQNRGVPVMHIAPLNWDDEGWPSMIPLD